MRPDEQHRCLGTFYERIELRISFAEALKYNCSGVLQRLLKENSKYQLLINGQLDMDIMGQYIQSAKQNGVLFAIRNSQYYRADSNSAAVILCADHALNRDTVDVLERYPQLNKDV
ncbi:YueI family protein [Lactiplantibacillus plantarum]|nr:YueI family protein [Lactiplantibacillus plantarum]WBF40122.1 YueI family protein [Lactiplantibacillus plantarum]